MKKIICALIAFALMLAFSMPAFAATDLSAVFDSNDFLKQYEQEILYDINSIIYWEFNESAPEDDKIYNTYPLSKENFDYNRIIKFYFDTNLLSEDTLDVAKINNILNASKCFYEINMNLRNQIVACTFMKYYPLREELKGINPETEQEYEKVVGKWHATGIGISEHTRSSEIYKNNIVEFLKNQQINYKKVYFLSALGENFPFLTALFITEDSDIRFQILDGTINNKTIDYEHPDDTLYTFEEIKEMAAQYVPPAPGEIYGLGTDVSTDNNKTILIIAASAGAAVMIAVAVTIICLKKRKNKSINKV